VDAAEKILVEVPLSDSMEIDEFSMVTVGPSRLLQVNIVQDFPYPLQYIPNKQMINVFPLVIHA